MTQNDLTQNAMKSLSVYLKDYEMSRDLVSLVLDKNEIGNDGLRELSNGLIERFNAMDRDQNNMYTINLQTNMMSNCI